MARGEQLQRQWMLLKTLQTRGEGIPLRQLAEDLSVSERTMQRDLEMLQELGFPVRHEDDDYGKRFWRMPHDFFRTGPLTLSLTEAISLHLADRMFAPLSGTPFAEGLHSLLTKIRSHVPVQALDYFAELEDTLYVRRIGTTDYSPQAEVIRVLTETARSGRTVEIRYRALWRGEEYTTRFDPYGLVYYDGDLFAVGRSHRADAIRVFKIIRITSASGTTARFDRPADFDLERQFHSCFGITQSDEAPVEIDVQFTGPVAGLVEEKVWHESQQLKWLPAEGTLFSHEAACSGTLLARFRLANVVEFKRWIQGFGRQAEVIRPDWLRRELRDELLETVRLYEA